MRTAWYLTLYNQFSASSVCVSTARTHRRPTLPPAAQAGAHLVGLPYILSLLPDIVLVLPVRILLVLPTPSHSPHHGRLRA